MSETALKWSLTGNWNVLHWKLLERDLAVEFSNLPKSISSFRFSMLSNFAQIKRENLIQSFVTRHSSSKTFQLHFFQKAINATYHPRILVSETYITTRNGSIDLYLALVLEQCYILAHIERMILAWNWVGMFKTRRFKHIDKKKHV